MKYRRKPVERSVVDAIYDAEKLSYIVQFEDGGVNQVVKEVFERDYEAVQRVRVPKEKKKRRRANSDQPVTSALPPST